MVLALLLAQAHAGTYLAIDAAGDQLVTVDTATRATRVVGPLGFNYDFGDAAYDDATGTFYIVQARPTPSLAAVDVATGRVTLIGPLAVNEIFAADVEPASGQIMAIQNSTGDLYRIDPQTAATTFVAATGIAADGGSWDDARGGLVVNTIAQQNYTLVDLSGRTRPLANNNAFTDNNDFDLEVATGRIFSMDWSTNRRGYDGATFALVASGQTAYNTDAGAIIDNTPFSQVTLQAIGGACPGPVSVQISGLTPGGQVAVARANAAGNFAIPVGGCAGTQLGLRSPSLLYQTAAPNNGTLSVRPTLAAGFCGSLLQAIDLTTCAVSNVWIP